MNYAHQDHFSNCEADAPARAMLSNFNQFNGSSIVCMKVLVLKKVGDMQGFIL
jgi:hypothetical protein